MSDFAIFSFFSLDWRVCIKKRRKRKLLVQFCDESNMERKNLGLFGENVKILEILLKFFIQLKLKVKKKSSEMNIWRFESLEI